MKSILVPMLAAVCLAQRPAPKVADTVVSPEVSGNRVTFRIYAPKAEKVTLSGDWMKLGSSVPLTRDDRGVWSVTAGPFEPQVHLYTFNVDGMVIADPVNPRIKLRARTSASLVEIPGDAPWIAKEVPHGKVEMITHHSKVTGDMREIFVYTPPGYDENRSRKYPVLYLFHGNNDVAAGWTWTGRAHIILDNLIAAGKAKPMIVVMPWAHATPFGAPGNTELFERYLIEETVPLTDARYRTLRNPASRALAGLSMGAGQSAYAGLRHLDLFGNIGLFSGGQSASFEKTHQAVLADPKSTNARLKLFWIGIGTEDEGLERNREFRAMLRKRGIRFTEAEGPGAHFYPVFRRELADFAQLLFR